MTESKVKRMLDARIYRIAMLLGVPVHILPISDKFNTGLPDRLILTSGAPFMYEAKLDGKKYGFTKVQKGKARLLYSDLGIKTYGIESKDMKTIKIYDSLDSEAMVVHVDHLDMMLEHMLTEAIG